MALPLRDYYPVTRAANLLGCEVNDLFHWARRGYIELYAYIDSACGVVHMHELDYFLPFIDQEVRGWVKSLQEESLRAELDDFVDEKINRIMGVFCKLNYLKEERIYLYSLLNFLAKGWVNTGFCWLKNLKHEARKSVEDAYYFEDVCAEHSFNRDSEYIAEVGGFFSIDSHNILEDIELNGCCISSGENFEGVYSGLSVFLPQSNNINLNKNNLFLFKDDFIILNDFSSEKEGDTGEQLNKKYLYGYDMESIYIQLNEKNTFFQPCDESISRQSEHKKELNPQLDKKTRVSKAERVFIQLAIKEHYHEFIDSPGTIANIFTALSKKHESPFDFDKSTIGRWIKTAR
ncbi:hypothetical protein MB851_003760 [Escherichia coli]|nr:hypothetical protein [Escherichia coli]